MENNYIINLHWDWADIPLAVSNDRYLYLQATFSVKNHDILNYDALHFKLPRSVLKIASFEVVNLKYLKCTLGAGAIS